MLIDRHKVEVEASAVVLGFLGRHRTGAQLTIDATAWWLGFLAALLIRFDFQPPTAEVIDLLSFLPIVVLVRLGFGALLGLYHGRWRFGSFEEVIALGYSCMSATAVLFMVNLIPNERITPMSV